MRSEAAAQVAVLNVSKDFITDGSSIPQFMWSILPVWESYIRAGVIHDYCATQSRSTIPIEKPGEHAGRL